MEFGAAFLRIGRVCVSGVQRFRPGGRYVAVYAVERFDLFLAGYFPFPFRKVGDFRPSRPFPLRPFRRSPLRYFRQRRRR
jgi:hypothetical protein